jgi:hypothetical protein
MILRRSVILLLLLSTLLASTTHATVLDAKCVAESLNKTPSIGRIALSTIERTEGRKSFGIFRYTDKWGRDHVVKILHQGRGDADLRNEYSRAKLMEREGGPKVYGSGTTRVSGIPYGYLDLEPVFPKGEFLVTKECDGNCTAKFTPSQTQSIVNQMVDRLMKTFVRGVVPTDPDFAISNAGRVRWIDSGMWQDQSDFHHSGTPEWDGFRAHAGAMLSICEQIQGTNLDAPLFRRFLVRLKDSNKLTSEQKTQWVDAFANEVTSPMTENLTLLKKLGIIGSKSISHEEKIHRVRIYYDSLLTEFPEPRS